jgi:heme-degrading monooxygenase HmoA
VLPELRTIAGFLGATLLSEDQAGETEFLVLTRWQSIEAVRAFAGNDLNRAVVDPAAISALVSFDRVARHYQVVDEVF